MLSGLFCIIEVLQGTEVDPASLEAMAEEIS
jgi:hypothetical protein